MAASARAPKAITDLLVITPPKAPRRRKSRILGVVPEQPKAPVSLHEAAIADMDETFLDCRDVGHQWLRRGAKLVEQGKQIAQHFTCHCGASKERRLSHRGEILWNSVKYPEGFLMPAGSGRMTADDRATVRMRMVAVDLHR